VIALAYCHIIAEAPLGWFGGGDVPTSIVPETGGPGDDFLAECGPTGPRFEVQVKHGLSGRQEIVEMIRQLAPASNQQLVLVVDSTSSGTIRTDFRSDLDRLRSGRASPLSEFTQRVRDAVPAEFAAAERLRVVQVDIDSASHSDTRLALTLLRNSLVDPDQAGAAFETLVADAVEACARRLQRTRSSLIALLQARGFDVRPRQPNDRWHARLDMTNRLLDGFRSEAVLAELNHLSSEIATGPAEPRVRYRLAVQRSRAYRQRELFNDALRYAREAIDIDPEGLEGYLNACYASLAMGDRAAAGGFATAAQRVAPADPRAWITSLWVVRGTGQSAPMPPAAVAEDTAYLTALAQVAYAEQRFREADDLSSRVMQAGLRTADILLVRAQAAFAQTALPPTPGDRTTLADVDRWASEALDQLSNYDHPTARVALAVRAEVRFRLGRDQDAASDVERLQNLDPDDPNGLIRMARILEARGNPEDALALLRRPIVAEHAELLAVRARLELDRGRRGPALEDLDAAERRLADAFDPDMVRAQLSEIAGELGDLSRAERLLATANTASVRVQLAKARLLWSQERIEEAARQYRRAADAHPEARLEFLLELALRFLHKSAFAEAVATFDAIGEGNLPEESLPSFARALLGSGALVRAQQLVERFSAAGPLPEWAIRVAVDLAGRREDVETQVALLEELVRRGGDEVRVRYALIGHLVELGRREEAETHLERVLSLGSLSALERMQGALFLKELGQVNRAVALAFVSYREQPNDAHVARGFIVATHLSGATPREVNEVGADTYVELLRDDGETQAYSIYADPPVDSQRGECLVADAEALGLMGKRVGDRIERVNAGWTEQWTVTLVHPVELHAAQDAAQGYARRFPREPFFVTSIPVGDAGSVRDLAPMIASLERRRAFVELAFAAYAEQGLPLGVIAQLLALPIPSVMGRSDRAPFDIPLLVEWGPPGDQADVRRTLAEATILVLSRSALHSAAAVGILSILPRAYRLLAPRTLRSELDNELREAKRELENGRRSIAAGPEGLRAEDLPAGHPILRAALDRLEEQKAWLLANVTLEARPLEIVARESARGSQLRETVGAADHDAVALASYSEAVLYVDDLGLRRLDIGEPRPRSCSTVTLLQALAERGAISADERDTALTELVRLRYATIIPSPELILRAVAQVPSLGRDSLQRVMSLLGISFQDLGTAVDLLVDTLRRYAATSIQTVSVGELTFLGLGSMAASWPRAMVASAVERAASRTLRLLPRTMQECLNACQRFRGQAGGGGSTGIWRP